MLPIRSVAVALAAVTSIVLASLLSACGKDPPAPRVYVKPAGKFFLTSLAFAPDTPIPTKHAWKPVVDAPADAPVNISPPLVWRDVPQLSAEIAIVVDDPDATSTGPFVHWLAWGIPAIAGSIPEGLSGSKTLPAGFDAFREGENGFRERGWGGPHPPAGRGPHRYRFTAYALSKRLDLAAGSRKQALLDAMVGAVLGTAETFGTYERQPPR